MVKAEGAQVDPHADPVADRALDWFLRLRDGADPALMAEFRAWLAEDPRHAEEIRLLQALWDGPDFLCAVRALPANLPGEMAAGTRARRWRGRAAAGLALVLLAGAVWLGPEAALDLRADYRTETGERREMRLPDGSRMILNSNSAVALDFEAGRRQVRVLRGEAYFDVVHDPAHPFRVAGHYGEAEVKGTAFGFRRDAARDEIVLQRGRLEVSCACEDPARVTLLPGQGTHVSRRGAEAAAPADIEQKLEWRAGRLSRAETTVGALVDELSGYWPGRIVIARAGLGQKPIGGSYSLGDIPAALASIAAATGATVTRLPGRILILK